MNPSSGLGWVVHVPIHPRKPPGWRTDVDGSEVEVGDGEGFVVLGRSRSMSSRKITA